MLTARQILASCSMLITSAGTAGTAGTTAHDSQGESIDSMLRRRALRHTAGRSTHSRLQQHTQPQHATARHNRPRHPPTCLFGARGEDRPRTKVVCAILLRPHRLRQKGSDTATGGLKCKGGGALAGRQAGRQAGQRSAAQRRASSGSSSSSSGSMTGHALGQICQTQPRPRQPPSPSPSPLPSPQPLWHYSSITQGHSPPPLS